MDEARIDRLAEALAGLARNGIRIETGKPLGSLPVGASKFGGIPDCPPDFVWPEYEGEALGAEREEEEYTLSFTRKGRIRESLTFLAQFDCREVSLLDTEGLLPREGLLSFFYGTRSMRWGFDPADEGCARVYWFPRSESLSPTPPPETAGRIPPFSLSFFRENSLPSYDDFCGYEEADRLISLFPGGTFWEAFDAAARRLGFEEDGFGDRHRLLGWPDVIQDSMPFECEMVSSGYYMGDGSGMDRLTAEEKRAMAKRAREEWILLFQMGTLRTGEYELMWGDCGHIYFWIRREDLGRRDFSRIRLILQCG